MAARQRGDRRGPGRRRALETKALSGELAADARVLGARSSPTCPATAVDFADDINPIIGGAQPGLDKWELATGLDPSTNGQAVYLAYTHYYYT
jgi:hypothetical protein